MSTLHASLDSIRKSGDVSLVTRVHGRVNCSLDPTTDDKSWRTSSDIISRPLLLANLGKSAHSRWCRLQAYPAIDFAREEPGPMDQRVASLHHLADVHVRRRPRYQILGVVIGGGVDSEEIRAKM